ncbi:MAG: hypothetical protein U0S12_13815 [Fimbriimonadales bacterium]
MSLGSVMEQSRNGTRAGGISDVLFRSNSRGFDSIAPVPTNIDAIETALLFSSGLLTFGALLGPSGWGKSHLLEAASERLQHESGAVVPVTNALDWVHQHAWHDSHGAVILDNVQDVLSRPKVATHLHLLLERRVKSGRPTLIALTAPKVTRQLKLTIPCGRRWTYATLGAPGREEREPIIRHIGFREGLTLSDELVRIMSRRVSGDGRTLVGALKRLKLVQTRWIGPEGVLRGCGVLEPFFGGAAGWDLRDHIMEAAERFPTSINRLQLAGYVMLRVASLPEANIARYLSVEPAELYCMANRFGRQTKDCEHTTNQLHEFVERVVRGLERD